MTLFISESIRQVKKSNVVQKGPLFSSVDCFVIGSLLTKHFVIGYFLTKGPCAGCGPLQALGPQEPTSSAHTPQGLRSTGYPTTPKEGSAPLPSPSRYTKVQAYKTLKHGQSGKMHAQKYIVAHQIRINV